MKKIQLTLGKYALVDDVDFEELNSCKWYALRNFNTFYAVRSKPRKGGQPRKKLHMHRVLIGLEEGDGKIIDHVNGDGLDNRRENLRLTSSRGNCQNAVAHRNGKLPGTHKLPSGNFEARLRFKGRPLYIGVFPSEEEAHEAYKEFAAKSI